MNVSIIIHQHNASKTFSFPKDELISHLLRDKGFIALPCGVGKCGKCRIKANSIATKEEIEALSAQDISNNIRLACFTRAFDGLEITLLEDSPLIVLTNFIEQSYQFKPIVESVQIKITPPSLEDQRDDLKRVLEAAHCHEHIFTINDLIDLSYKIHSHAKEHEDVEIPLRVLRQEGMLLRVDEGVTPPLCIAIDVGTTTIAATLINITNYETIAVLGEANNQASFGADVISRINQTIEESNTDFEKNILALQNAVVTQIENLQKNLLTKAFQEGHLPEVYTDVDYIAITGNTTMMHLLCALPAKNISRAPFIPIAIEPMRLRASEIHMQSRSIIYIMPSIASYVGADIVAAMLSVDAHCAKEPFLLLDLGTNAEIVLGYDKKFLACSAAAGPCFEGASLSCGLAGKAGAINHVEFSDNEKGFAYSTINNEQAKGLCGSGVLDTLALLLDAGIIDETGMMLESEDISEEYRKLAGSLSKVQKEQSAFILCENVYLSQKDVREVQLAKSAVRAGIHTLLAEANIKLEDVKNLYIAGGFGSAMSPKSAAKIGLIPQELLHCTKAVGNAASHGVIKYATEKNVLEHVDYIVRKTRYLELSSSSVFTGFYVEHMVF